MKRVPMQRALTISLAMAVVLPLLAQESKRTTQESAEKTSQKTASTSETKAAQAITAQNTSQLVPAQPVTTQDSPLVAAAKRANRLGKKPANVITNETLALYGRTAHIATAETAAANLPHTGGPPPSPTPEMEAYAKADEHRKKADEREARAKKTAEERKKTLAQKAEAAEEGLYDLEEDDPASLEREHSDAAAKANEKPPAH